MTGEMRDLAGVMDVLAQCGWVPDTDRCLEDPCLKFNFGNFELSATTCTNFYLQRVVLIAGLFHDGRTLQQVEFEVPERLESPAQVLAWVAFGIGKDIPLALTPEWLKEGRRSQELLPWVHERAAYQRRPRASVARDWMRLLGKQLRAEAESAAGMDTCRIHFDGNALSFTLGGKTLIVQASGNAPWPVDVIVPLPSLRWLPKRWMQDPVDVSYWDGHISIANHSFVATIQPTGNATSAAASG